MKRALVLALVLVGACRPTPATRKANDVTVGPAKGGSGISASPCAEESGEPIEAEEAFGRKVAVLCIEGVRSDSRPAIERALGFGAGAVLTEKGLRDGLEAIHKTGIVDDAVAYGWKLGPGVVLSLRLRERPRVGKVVVDGASAVNVVMKPAPERTPLHPGEHYDPAYAQERARALRDGYVSTGYEDATVTPETRPAGDGTIDVHMVVHEGVRSRIGTVSTKGVTPALEAGLLGASGLVRGDPLDPEVVEAAPLKMTAFYFESGYISVNVHVDRGARGSDGVVPLTVAVTEGPVFRVGKLRITKSELDEASTQRILSSLKTKSGAVFRRTTLVSDIDAVKHAFADRGRTVEVDPVTEVNQAKHTIDVALEINAH